MANSWVRLWVDMPTDPKFRTIAKVSKQPLTSVISMFVILITDAANATERGRTHVNDEDVASALDLEIEQVSSIREAMQGRVLNGDYLTGWDLRQPLREDNSAERSKAWREKQKTERNRTQPNATELQDKIREDKNKDIKEKINKKEKFSPPTSDEVSNYILEKGYSVNASSFVNFYASKNWMVGKSKMKCWRSAVNTWQQREVKNDRQATINSLNF